MVLSKLFVTLDLKYVKQVQKAEIYITIKSVYLIYIRNYEHKSYVLG